MYIRQSGNSNVVDATVNATTVIAMLIGHANDLGKIMSSDEDFVNCTGTQEANNCRYAAVGGGIELTMTCIVTPTGLEDSREITFTGPSGVLAAVQVNGEYNCTFFRAC